MDKNTDTCCVLRILTGVAAGAEVELRAGLEYQLGRSDEMDLIIDDPALGESHARIQVEGQSVRVSPVDDAEIHLHGERFEGGIVPLYVVLRLGDTLVVFGDQKRAWNTVEIPQDASVAPVVRSTTPRATVAEQDDSDAEQGDGVRRSWRLAGIVRGVLALTALVVVALPTALAGWRLLEMRHTAAERIAEQESPIIALGKQIQHILAPAKSDHRAPGWSQKWSALHLVRVGKTWAIQGYLDTTTELSELRSAVGQKPVLLQVKVRDVLEQNLKQVMTQEKLDLGVKYIGDGRFAITGEVQDEQAWSNEWVSLVDRVQADIPDIVDLVDRTSMQVTTATKSKRSTPAAVAQQSEKQGPDQIVVPIKSVSVGRSGCLTLTNGERLFVGAQLPGGYRIDEIAVEQIVASRDGKRVILKLDSGL